MSKNISRTVQGYLTYLAGRMNHYATLRLFGGVEARAAGRLCLDAQVPILTPGADSEYIYSLTVQVSYCKEGVYRRELLQFDGRYNPTEILALGPARWEQTADLVAYQFIGQLVQWVQDKHPVVFNCLAATIGLKADRQRFYI